VSYTLEDIENMPRWARELLRELGGLILDLTKYVVHDKCAYGCHAYHG
jgi:hypothetical protein